MYSWPWVHLVSVFYTHNIVSCIVKDSISKMLLTQGLNTRGSDFDHRDLLWNMMKTKLFSWKHPATLKCCSAGYKHCFQRRVQGLVECFCGMPPLMYVGWGQLGDYSLQTSNKQAFAIVCQSRKSQSLWGRKIHLQFNCVLNILLFVHWDKSQAHSSCWKKA